MFENDGNEEKRPRFDASTGQPIHYEDDVQENSGYSNTEQTASEQQTAQQESASYEQEDVNRSNAEQNSAQQESADYGQGYTGQSDASRSDDTQSDASQSDGIQSYAEQSSTQQEGMPHYESYTGTVDKQSRKAKKNKKKFSFKPGKKVKFVLSAIAFGVIAGAIVIGMNYVASRTINKQSYTINTTTASLTSATTSDTGTSSSGSLDVTAISNAVLPAMVQLNGTETVSSSSSSSSMFGYGQSYQASVSGTGIIVGQNDTELLILTNAHVIADVDNLTCVFVDGQSVSASVKGSRSDKDVAVVAVNISDIQSSTMSQIAIAELGDSDGVVVGQQVVAIGNALGEGQSVTVGWVSALNRSITVNNYTYDNLIMTDAAINAGNSGGALLNSSGQVIGINFAKSSSDGVEGMAYSIPISTVKDLITSLMNQETRTAVSASNASYLGISGLDIDSTAASNYGYPEGVLIRQIQSGSPADKAGLQSYDIIVSFEGQTVSSMSGLKKIMQYYASGETVTIGYYHLDGNEYVLKTVEVTLGSSSSTAQ